MADIYADQEARQDEILRRIAAETEALPRHKLPGFFSWAAGHPSLIGYRTKDPERYDSDRRRAHFLTRVREELPGAARGSLASRYPEISESIGRDRIDRFASAYEPYGEDHPVWNTMVWAQSLPSAVLATGQMLGNAVDPKQNRYPDAARQYAKSVNTFTGGLAEDVGLLPRGTPSRWRELQDMRSQMHWNWKSIDPQMGDAIVKAAHSPDVLDGQQFLEAEGVPERYSPYLGAAMDVTLDPFTGFSAASKASRMGRNLDAMKALGADFGLGVAPAAAVPAAISVGRAYEDAAAGIRKLLGVDY